MNTTAEAHRAQQRRAGLNLATAATVGVLCVLGIVTVHLIRRFLNAVARGRTDEP